MSEQVPSKEKLPDWLRRWYALKGEPRFREAADEIERLQDRFDIVQEQLEKVVKERNELRQAAQDAELRRLANEPPDDRPTDEHVDRFSNWLAGEMPAGTVIGDPKWWARKLLNAAYVYAPDASSQPPLSEYLKDGETAAECIERNRRDVVQSLGMLADERAKTDDLATAVRLLHVWRSWALTPSDESDPAREDMLYPHRNGRGELYKEVNALLAKHPYSRPTKGSARCDPSGG